MSNKYPLTYPALPIQAKRVTFSRLWLTSMKIPHGYFDAFFGCKFMRGTFKRISGHGTVPLIIGLLLAATGSSAMLFRFVGLLVCALWLSLDIGIWLSKSTFSKFVKHWLFCAATCLCFVLAMRAMEGILISALTEEQDDVFQKLTAIATVPPSGETSKSFFTFTNGGKTDIGMHQVSCNVGRIISISNKSVWTGSPDSSVFEDFPINFPIRSGGDAQSTTCLYRLFKDWEPISCADVRVRIRYSLVTQPTLIKQKEFRFVMQKILDQNWHPEPVDLPEPFCQQPN
jgi:hypothetical protein